MKITWMHDNREIRWPPTFEEKVEIFYQRTLGWQLHIADIVSNGGKPFKIEGDAPEFPAIPHAGFAVLQICLSYFETIAQYLSPNPQSKKSNILFKEGVRSVFPQLAQGNEEDVSQFLDILWDAGRNGLYHISMTRGGIGLGKLDHLGENFAMAFYAKEKQLVIDPHILPKALKSHLKKYRDYLLDSKNVKFRQYFEAMFNKENGIQQ